MLGRLYEHTMTMRTAIILLSFFSIIPAFAQNAVTFEVEKLSKPETWLPTQTCDDIYKNLILSDVNLWLGKVKRENIDYPFHIITQSEAPEYLVSFNYNSFFNGMYRAYADHRPFVLSPDMIWLLISQGFSRHVKINQDSMRHYFVDYPGQQTLIVETNKKPDDPTINWEGVVSGFTRQVKKQVGNELVDLLTCDFSKTTSLEKIASEITIMETMKPYFEFLVMRIVCGIPQITLEGTPEDWKRVLGKAKGLKKYELEWWISELEPLLEEFVKASEGKVDTEFWRNMFKYHSQKMYGAPNIIDGWIVKFFPYDKYGKRNNLQRLAGTNSLPQEIVKVDVKYMEAYNDTIIETPLELWAGFIGLKQNFDNFALRPQIGWMVRKKDVDDKEIMKKLTAEAQDRGMGGGINLKVKKIPAMLLKLEEIKQLKIHFIDEIDIPDELSKVKIDDLELYGEITEEGINRIKRMFPDAGLKINDTVINRNPNSKPIIIYEE